MILKELKQKIHNLSLEELKKLTECCNDLIYALERHKFLNKDINHVLFCNLGQDALEGHYTEQLLTTGYLLNNEKKKDNS